MRVWVVEKFCESKQKNPPVVLLEELVNVARGSEVQVSMLGMQSNSVYDVLVAGQSTAGSSVHNCAGACSTSEDSCCRAR